MDMYTFAGKYKRTIIDSAPNWELQSIEDISNQLRDRVKEFIDK